MATLAEMLEEMKEFFRSTVKDTSVYIEIFLDAVSEQYDLTPVSMIFVKLIWEMCYKQVQIKIFWVWRRYFFCGKDQREDGKAWSDLSWFSVSDRKLYLDSTWRVLKKARTLRKESSRFTVGTYICAAASCIFL